MECPDESALLDFLEGVLSEERREAIQAHLEGCRSCRALVAQSGGSTAGEPGLQTTTAPDSPRAQPPIARGTPVGRYVILEPLGMGGMGVVYAAYDPELDRRVALKLLRAEQRGASGLRARLVREAQALAKLSHPNVVAVHDVGELGDRVFLAMDLVEGGTLAVWLKEAPRSQREILAVFLAAGRGLAAAHAAGLVHRDFKPGNVLVGKDGQVRVMDFGLARGAGGSLASAETPFPSLPEAGPISSDALTQEGTLLGTPAYMAPEQRRGDEVDARSDQYSFCISLHEALYGERPPAPAKTELVPLSDAQLVAAFPDAKVPGWLRKVLVRGLQPSPDDRYPSMEALLADLAYDPERARRRRFAAGATALAALVAALGSWAALRAHGPACPEAEQALARVWNPERKALARAAFEATGRAYAPAAWAGVEQALDAYASGWARMSKDACEATRVRGEQTEAQLALRSECLKGRLDGLDALAARLARADAPVVDSSSAPNALEPLSDCADLSALAARLPPPPGPEAQARLARLHRELAEARALLETGNPAAGLEQAKRAAEEARALDHAPARAQALFVLGRLQATADAAAAERLFHGALWAAQEGHDDALAARAWLAILHLVGNDPARLADARTLERHATAAVGRLGWGRARELEAALHDALGDLRMREGAFDRAQAEYQAAVSLLEKELGREHPGVIGAVDHLGRALAAQGKHAEALTQAQRAYALRERVSGPGHPEALALQAAIGEILREKARIEAKVGMRP